ncbi:hypothetical protein CPZ06_10010 [Lactobacillus acidophilus]|nr:hypothetical protein CPZ06_10010 [Lactobacillus acidophilus]
MQLRKAPRSHGAGDQERSHRQLRRRSSERATLREDVAARRAQHRAQRGALDADEAPAFKVR